MAESSSDLTLLNIKIFLKEEDFPTGKADELGIYLGIKPGRISTFKKASGGDRDRLLSIVITEWLNNDKEKSWRKLAKALRHCDYPLMADKILKKDILEKVSSVPAGGDDLGDIDGTTELTMKDHFEVKKYTDDLNQQEVEDLGLALGLYKKTLNRMSPQTIHGDAIEAWLKGQDNVIGTCGTTTWRALAKGFQAVEQHDFVEKIRRDHPSQNSSARGRVDMDGGTKTPESEDSLELDENERKAIFDEAMSFGHIDVSIIKILIVGAGGVGKSCLLRFLCDLSILKTYSSTTLINAAQRVKCERVRTSKDNSSGEIVWELVGPEKLKSVLADAIKSRAAKLEADAIKSRAAKTLSPQGIPLPSNVGSSQSSEPESTQSSSEPTQTRSEPESTQTSSEPESTQTSSLESIGEVIGLLKYKEGKLFSVTWIYLVDSGGQPQFHELLTAFVRNATLGIFVLNLSEQLEDKPDVKYYKNGQPCGKSYKFPLSHKEIFQHCVQTISSLCPINHPLPSTETEESSTTSIETEEPSIKTEEPSTASVETEEPFTASIETEETTVTSEFIKPKILVVGTHRKKESKSKESREEKEKKLKEILQPYGTGIIKNAGKHIIFPIDSISRKKSDKKVRDEIRKGIFAVKPFCKKQLPLQYYALELELDYLAEKEKHDVISFEGCFKKIGPSLNFSQKTFLAAIQHLDRLNLILYFKSQAPDVIFTNPNTLLDKVGEIVEKSYIWRGKVPTIEDQWVSDESVLLINRGEVTLEVLKSFESSYVEGLFDHNTLTRILTHLFVLLPKAKDKYFMPALLDVNLDVTSPTEDYFAVSFPGNAPMGLFSSSVVCLLSKYKWKEMNTPGHLFRNSLTFKVDIAQVTLLDRRTHFEVHIKKNIKKALPKLRARIREDVINAVYEVKEARHLYNLEFSSKCFCCPCSSSPPHLAEYKFSEYLSDYILDCTKDGGSFEVRDWHKEWLGIFSPSMKDFTIEKEDILEKVSSVPVPASGDDLGDIDGTTELTMDNRMEVRKYTNDLNQQEVEDLGSVLGLYKKTFNKTSPQTIHKDTIEAWLKKQDDVIKNCGTTTWRALAKGFQAVKQHGYVEKIQRDHPSQDSSVRDIDGGTKTPGLSRTRSVPFSDSDAPSSKRRKL